MAEKDDTTPETAVFVRQQVSRGDVVLDRRENDGSVRLAHRVDLPAASDHESRSVDALTIVGFDDRAGFDMQLGTVFDNHKTVEVIDIVIRPVDHVTSIDAGIGDRDGRTGFNIIGLC